MSTEDTIFSPEIQAEIDRAEKIVEGWFPKGSTPRSKQFKEGAEAYLRSIFAGLIILCHYSPSTAEHDAFFAGVDGARKLYRAMEGK